MMVLGVIPPSDSFAQQRTPGCDDRCRIVRYVDPADLDVVLGTLHNPATHEAYGALLGDTRFPPWVNWGTLSVDLKSGEVWYGGSAARLTPVELAIFRALAADIGQVVPHETILARVYGWSQVDASSQHLVRANVWRLRAKLGAGAIETFPGYGYRLAAPPAEDEEA